MRDKKCQEKHYDIIRQKMTDVKIPTKSAKRAAYKTKRVFLILTVLVYNAIVYKVVSVEPMMVEAIKPIEESTPYFVIISVAIAIDALPEIGRRMANGKTSAGNFNTFKTGSKSCVMASMRPEALKT